MRYVFFIACVLDMILAFFAFYHAHSAFYAGAFIVLLVLSALGVWDLVHNSTTLADFDER